MNVAVFFRMTFIPPQSEVPTFILVKKSKCQTRRIKLLVIDLYALSKLAEKSFNPSEFNGMGDNSIVCNYT